MQPRSKGWLGKGLVLLGAAAWCSVAAAQYIWLDHKGIKQYSDKPPPASVPDSRILKPVRQAPASDMPGLAAQAATSAAGSGAAPADRPATAAKPAPTLADRNAEFNKRRAEQAEQDKKAAQEQRLALERSKNCERAASYKRNLESGARIARVQSNGERVFISDEQRMQEIREAAKLLESCT